MNRFQLVIADHLVELTNTLNTMAEDTFFVVVSVQVLEFENKVAALLDMAVPVAAIVEPDYEDDPTVTDTNVLKGTA